MLYIYSPICPSSIALLLTIASPVIEYAYSKLYQGSIWFRLMNEV